MKKIAFALLCISGAIFASCGSSNSEADFQKEKQTQDSISKIEGDDLINSFNESLLADSTTNDSAKKTESAPKK